MVIFIECENSDSHSGITVFKNFDKFCFLVAFFEITKCLQEGCIPYFVGVADEADESDHPEYRPEIGKWLAFGKRIFIWT